MVAGSNPAEPRTSTFSTEEFDIREMLGVLLGTEGKRKIRLRRKTNEELFTLYDAQLALRHRSIDALGEAKQVLGHFQKYLGEYSPSPELAVGSLSQFANHEPTTLYRYNSIVKTFMAWYGEKLDTKIRLPERIPEYVEDADIERLKVAMRSKKTHKKVIERNLLIIVLACKAGLRRGELAKLAVRDIDLERNYLTVRQGKGMKDRIIDLTPSLQQSLQSFIKGKPPDESVFGLEASTVSGIIRWAARKAGVSIHTHSLRHFFGQSLVDTGSDLETVRRLMGHRSIRTTQVYLGRTDKQRREAIDRLEPTGVTDLEETENNIIKHPSPDSEGGLYLRVREVRLVGSSGEIYLVLLRLTFVNPSSIGKTVFHIGSGVPRKQGVSNPKNKYIVDNSMIRVVFSQKEQISVDIRKEDFLILPFDIPHHESRSFWMPLEIHQESLDSTPPQVQLYLIAEDISGKPLAIFKNIIELKTYTVP
ncbi:tyrosine-type recombinase/integrase [Chloroflexota bacterium]